jgi:uncharacterized protein
MISILVTVIGLILFEVVSSIDNAVINAEVLSKMGKKAKQWFLTWGLLFAVFVVRGLLPVIIVWLANTQIPIWETAKGVFTNDPKIAEAVEKSSPYLLLAGGVFLVFLFFNWLFLEEKEFGLPHEPFFNRHGIWFYTVVSTLLCVIVWESVQIDPYLALSAVIGSTAFFLTHGFAMQAEKAEKELLHTTSSISDNSKILFLLVIDSVFSIDGVVGAFAFTTSVPLILLGNGIGAFVVRQLTVGNIERIKSLIYLKNGAMYSLAVLGTVMVLEAFHAGLKLDIPQWFSPLSTLIIITFFYVKSLRVRE